MAKTVKVNFRNKVYKEFPVDTSLYEISKSFASYFDYEILTAQVDNKIFDLSDKIKQNCQIDFYDRSSICGNAAYARSLLFMLVLAVRQVVGKEAQVLAKHSVDKGVYCEIINGTVDQTVIKMIETEMWRIQKQGFLFNKLNVSRHNAMRYFEKNQQIDKVRVLRYISNSNINLYRLDDYYDYFYGEMAYSTSALNSFQLIFLGSNGFVLSYPDVSNPAETLGYIEYPLFFAAFKNYINWGRKIGLTNAADLNDQTITGKYESIIHLSETHFNRQLASIAEQIISNKNKIKLVLIAGPTSSGKTTLAKKLEIFLRSYGMRTHQISLDSYFKNRVETPKDDNGNYDFESLQALDVTLFNQHLAQLLAGESVWIPEYNFVSGKREYRDRYLQIGANDIIVIEGLHGLNEELTSAVAREQKYKIFLTPLTQLNIDNHNRIHTTDIRKLRRIVRDNKFRNYSASDTLNMWHKIREGEQKYVYPYQDEADVVLNSSLVYEIAALKVYVEPLLFSVPEQDAMYPEALRLINFLRNFLPIPSDTIPQDSVLREFIGGSTFRD